MGRWRRQRDESVTTAGHSEGLSLLMDDAEELGRVRDLDVVLQVIKEVLPDSVLYLEGSRRHMAPELVEFLEANPAPHPMEVAKGTIWPKPAKFHLTTSRENLERVREIEGRHASPEICDHLVVYRDGRVLLTAYDAGDGEVHVSKRLPADVIERMRRIVRPPAGRHSSQETKQGEHD